MLTILPTPVFIGNRRCRTTRITDPQFTFQWKRARFIAERAARKEWDARFEFDDDHPALLRHAQGCLGECGASVPLGYEMPTHTDSFKDRADLGEAVEVRSTERYPFLKAIGVPGSKDAENGKIDNPTFAIVSCRIVFAADHVADVTPVGWEVAADVMQPEFEKDPGNKNLPAYFKPWKDTRPLDELIEIGHQGDYLSFRRVRTP